VDKRVQQLNERPFRREGRYVLYWAQMNRRVESNHGLLYAVELANERGIPVLFYEGLTCSYPYANDRMHTFVLEGVPETARRAARLGIGYCFHLRRRRMDPDDAVYRLAGEAAAVVTDDYPVFLARRHNASVPGKVEIPYFVVDSSCIVPMGEMVKREWAAYTIRPRIGRLMSKWCKAAAEVKVERAFEDALPEFHTVVTEDNVGELVSGCEIDHGVRPSLSYRGGRAAAERHLRVFLEEKLRLYAREKNEPAAHATSNLSPYLHFGHISSLEVALAVREYAKEHQLIAEEFLEELIVRRELAFNYARFSEDPASFGNLPEWARKTLCKHAADEREACYTREEFERAETHDALWNATQKELLLRGKIHGYYRMYWGKKIIEWSRTHQDALETMIYLHDRYALDGRDPNTYANILWCFGLHDRPWGEREVLGTVRYMSLEGMKRKTDVEAYLREMRHLESTGVDPFRVQ
jgi:deoxyribodipyrimidine photo-lyase